MGKLKKDENGFSAVALTLVLAAVVLIGFAGWYVWHHDHKAVQSQKPPRSQNPKSAHPSKTNNYSVSVTSYGAKGNGTTNDAHAFQDAINAVSHHGGGTVNLPIPSVSYLISTPVQLKSEVNLVGVDPTKVLLTGGIPNGYMLIAPYDAPASNFELSNFTINLNDLDKASGINLQHVSNLTINGLHLLNIGSGAGHWGINIGVSGARANLTTIVNSGITVENCLFDNINGPFEQLLVFNSQDVRIENNHFTNIAFHPSGGSLGLYQNDTNFLVENNTFGPNIGNNTIYFAIGDKSLQIIHNTFIGKGAESTQVGDNGIKGANESDHGLFGQTTADNITVENNSFSGLRIALQLGGVNGATVMGNTFSQNGTAILINNANILHKDNPNVEGVHSSNLTIANNVFSGDLANQTTVEGSGDAVPRRTKP